jgi:hypothetical protein
MVYIASFPSSNPDPTMHPVPYYGVKGDSIYSGRGLPSLELAHAGIVTDGIDRAPTTQGKPFSRFIYPIKNGR